VKLTSERRFALNTKTGTLVFLSITVILLSFASYETYFSASTALTSVDEPPKIRDREGNPITIPKTINRIISMGPSNTEILAELGYGDKVIAIDEYSANVAGIKPGIPKFSMMAPNGEQIINLEPDVIFVTGMSKQGGDDPLKIVADTGVCVIYIPSSPSIESIKEDILYISEVVGARLKGEEIVVNMEKEIETIRAIGQTITDVKKVYFEISEAPWMYSFGRGVYLNEMIELLGAVNIMADQESWILVTDETIFNSLPDVILTSVDNIDNPVDEIKSRPGWGELTAVRNNDVYYIDSDASSRPSHNIIKALKEMAKAIYPDKY
jgi:iron complex transport system substrate-binding protein